MRFVVLLLVLLLSACSSQENAQPVKPRTAEEGMILVPAGDFVMGSNKVDKEGIQKQFGFVDPLYADEHPQHRLSLKAYFIDTLEVSNVQYKDFVQRTSYREPPQWIQSGYNVHEDKLLNANTDRLRLIASDYFKLDRDTSTMSKEAILAALQAVQRERDKLPVTGVSWYDAYTYCKYAGKRIPTEAEWEKAARGAQGAEYPWGNAWLAANTNTGDQGESDATVVPVGSTAKDRSPFAVQDMAGNVSEWVNDWYEAYPGATYRHMAYGGIHKVVRGGGAGAGHYAISAFFRSARRAHADPSAMSTDVGFRCAKKAH